MTKKIWFGGRVTSGGYGLPNRLDEILVTRLRPFRNRDAAMTLAVFLARMNSGWMQISQACFPIDRRALVGHPDLPLSEDKIRGAIKTLESVGYLDRIPDPRGEYERTPATATAPASVKRRPIRFAFGSDFLATFKWIAKKIMERLKSPKRREDKTLLLRDGSSTTKESYNPSLLLGEKARREQVGAGGKAVFAQMAAMARQWSAEG